MFLKGLKLSSKIKLKPSPPTWTVYWFIKFRHCHYFEKQVKDGPNRGRALPSSTLLQILSSPTEHVKTGTQRPLPQGHGEEENDPPRQCARENWSLWFGEGGGEKKKGVDWERQHRLCKEERLG